MTDLMLTLVVPKDVGEHVEDILLSRPDLVRGFTVSPAEGHGTLVPLIDAGELVAGHAPRRLIRTLGEEAALRSLMAVIKTALPQANLYYWLTPVVEAGRL